MWRPTRSSVAPSQQSIGYAYNISDPSIRFPSAGFSVDPRYAMSEYEASFEALDANLPGESSDSNSVYTLDFRPQSKEQTRKSFNFVQHYKRERRVSYAYTQYDAAGYRNLNLPLRSVWEANFYSLALAPSVGFASVLSSHDGLTPLYSGPDLGVYHDEEGLASFAVSQMLPKIRPGASIINSIVELKDFRTIPRTMLRVESSLVALYTKIGKKSGFGLKPLRAIIGGGADVFLQNKFNILPLLQDITAVHNSARNVKDQLRKLISSSSVPQKKHFRTSLRNFRNSNDALSQPTAGGISIPVLTTRRIVNYTVKDFVATIEFSYKMPDSTAEELLRNGIRDYLGLQISPQVIWNAIPWSFVVDWVVGVGPWLSQFNPTLLQVATHISKFGWSVKVRREIFQSIDELGQVASQTEESYYRTPAQAPLVSSIRTSGINPSEFVLGSALLAVRE